jgi:hypothetical protein
MNQILSRCWKQGKMMTIDSKGMTGGLAILGTPTLCCWRISSLPDGQSQQNTRLIGSNKPGFLTNVYGPTTPGDKLNFIQNMDRLANLTIDHSWILGGDFNMVCHLEEKRGRTHRLEAESGHFQALIDKLCLIDLETQNGLFTWSNRCLGSQQVACPSGSIPHIRIPLDGWPIDEC